MFGVRTGWDGERRWRVVAGDRGTQEWNRKRYREAEGQLGHTEFLKKLGQTGLELGLDGTGPGKRWDDEKGTFCPDRTKVKDRVRAGKDMDDT